MDSLWVNGSWVRQVPLINYNIFELCKQLKNRWLIAESMTDDCWKANGIPNPHPWCPWQAGARRINGNLVAISGALIISILFPRASSWILKNRRWCSAGAQKRGRNDGCISHSGIHDGRKLNSLKCRFRFFDLGWSWECQKPPRYDRDSNQLVLGPCGSTKDRQIRVFRNEPIACPI